MNAEQLAAIKARADAATGPRLIYGHKSWAGENAVLTEEGHPVVVSGHGDQAKADAAFFAHARTDVPDLLAEVKRLTAELAELARDRDEFFDEICRLIPDEYDDDAAVEGIVLRWAKDQVEGWRKVRAAHQPCRFGPEQCTICAVLDGDEAP